MIIGGDDNDELNGDEGDDIIIGGNQSIGGFDVIRGGDGDDEITAGNIARSTDKDGNNTASSHWLYGNGGNDVLFGEDETIDQRMFGGEGRDVLIGGKDTVE